MDSRELDDLRLAWCALLRAPGVGCRTLNPLLALVADPRELIQRPPAMTPDRLRSYLKAPDWAAAERDLAWLHQPGNDLLTLDAADYPRLLRELPNAPSALFLHGDRSLLGTPQLAIVGSRSASAGGRRNAHDFAAELANAGLGITSGLASGIDAAAHRGALSVRGITLAVTGNGLDRVYPASNAELAHAIAAEGLLISEFPPGTRPLPGNFPRRNRLISGLTLGTLVVEAAPQSGSLITARLAAEQGREVFAIPGSIHNPLARGCHALLREGAKLVECAQDIIEELAGLLATIRPAAGAPPATVASAGAVDKRNPDHQTILDAMGFDPVSTDELVARTGFSAAGVSSILLLLELQGHVSSGRGGLFTRVASVAH